MVRDCDYQLIDVGFEASFSAGAMIATRLLSVGDFVMTAGVFVPLDVGFLRKLAASDPLFQRKPAAELINDRRLAEAIYRAAVVEGVTERMAYREPDEDPFDVMSQNARDAAARAA